MTEQTQHILNISQNLIERLSFIKIKPAFICCEAFSSSLIPTLKAMYPEAKINAENKADLLISLLPISEEQTEEWKKGLKSGGLLMFGFQENGMAVRDIGDYFVQAGFMNVVIDVEDGTIYGHAWMPRGEQVFLNEIRRV